MRKRPEAWARWRRIVAEQGCSGQSVAEFCRERELCPPTFFAWKRRLSQAAAGRFVAVQVVEAAGTASSRAVEVRLCGGRSIFVEPGFDAAHLRALLAVLEARA